RPVQDVHLGVGGGQLIGDRPRAVRAVVVGDEHVHGWDRPPDSVGDQAYVLRLVVGRDDDEYPTHTRVTLAHSTAFRLRTPLRQRRPGCSLRRSATARTSTPSAAAVSATSGMIPRLVAIVRPVVSEMSRRMTAGALNAVASYTLPDSSTKAETPTVDAISAGRPCSTARSRTMASCCSASASLKVALLVCTTISSAPPSTVSRTMLS